MKFAPLTRCQVTHDDVTKKIIGIKYNFVIASIYVLNLIEIKVCLIGKMADTKPLYKWDFLCLPSVVHTYTAGKLLF